MRAPKPPRFRAPRLTFDRFGQVVFTFREVTRIAMQVNRGMVIRVFVLSALWGFTSAPALYLEKLILDRLVANIGNPNVRSVVFSIVFLIATRLTLELTRNIFSRLNNYYSRTLSRLLTAHLDQLMGKKLAELDMATIEDPEFKDKFEKIRNESRNRAWNMMMPLIDIPNYIIGFISTLVLVLLLHPLVSLGIFLVSFPQFFVDRKFIKLQYNLNTRLAPKHKMWGWLSHYLIRNRNYSELKLLNLAGYLGGQLERVQAEIFDEQIRLSKKREFSRFWGIIPSSLFEFAIGIWLVVLVITMRITVGSFEMFLRAIRSAQSDLSGLVSSVLEIYENYMYVYDLVWFLNLESTIENRNEGEKLPPKLTEGVAMSDVWFRYREGQDWVLRGISFSVAPGERVAIVGENGAGKSTLIKILARFYDPGKGRVLVDGIDLNEVNIGSWRKHLAVLFQDFETYPFSAYDSIGYGDIDRRMEERKIEDAAARTGIDAYIENLPLKFANPLHPDFVKGVNPSGGQWQRIGIARMLFRDSADVVILDEPTSNVDPVAEEKIFNELLKKAGEAALIFVSQRFSSVRRADRIIVIDKGKVVESGTHKKLMKADGKYARLFRLQAKGYR